MSRQELLARFASFMMALKPGLWEEIRVMATEPGSIIDWEAVSKITDVGKVVKLVPPERIVQEVGA